MRAEARTAAWRAIEPTDRASIFAIAEEKKSFIFCFFEERGKKNLNCKELLIATCRRGGGSCVRTYPPNIIFNLQVA